MAEATSGNLQDPIYLAARAANLDFARSGINPVLARGDFDAIVAPTYSFASSPAAVAGFPNLIVTHSQRQRSPIPKSYSIGPR